MTSRPYLEPTTRRHDAIRRAQRIATRHVLSTRSPAQQLPQAPYASTGLHALAATKGFKARREWLQQVWRRRPRPTVLGSGSGGACACATTLLSHLAP